MLKTICFSSIDAPVLLQCLRDYIKKLRGAKKKGHLSSLCSIFYPRRIQSEVDLLHCVQCSEPAVPLVWCFGVLRLPVCRVEDRACTFITIGIKNIWQHPVCQRCCLEWRLLTAAAGTVTCTEGTLKQNKMPAGLLACRGHN